MYGHEQKSASKDNSNDVIEKEDEKGGHSGSIWPKPAKNKILFCDFTSFSKQVSADSHHFRFRSLHVPHIKKLSNCCRHK